MWKQGEVLEDHAHLLAPEPAQRFSAQSGRFRVTNVHVALSRLSSPFSIRSRVDLPEPDSAHDHEDFA